MHNKHQEKAINEKVSSLKEEKGKHCNVCGSYIGEIKRETKPKPKTK